MIQIDFGKLVSFTEELTPVLLAYISLALLALSVSGNAYLFQKLRKLKREPNSDARMLLADILRGGALVKLTRIAPEDVLLRSSRGSL